MNKLLVTLLLFCANLTAFSQNFAYRAGFNLFIDNLENSLPYDKTRTFTALSVAPEIGIHWDDHHSIMVGVSLVRDFEKDSELTDQELIAYYKYRGDKLSFLGGVFNRNNVIGHYPRSFFNERSNFYNNVISGLMLQYKGERGGYVELYSDWYGGSVENYFDEFMVNGSARQPLFGGVAFVGGAAQLTHYKNAPFLAVEPLPANAYLFERILYNIYVGVNLERALPFFDCATLSLGLLGDSENIRLYDDTQNWNTYLGASVDLDLRYRGFGFKNSLYMGNSQMPFYSIYGSDAFYWGSPFYQSQFYNRVDLYYLWKMRFMQVHTNVIFNFTDESLAAQQLVTVSFNISQLLSGGKPKDYDSDICGLL